MGPTLKVRGPQPQTGDPNLNVYSSPPLIVHFNHWVTTLTLWLCSPVSIQTHSLALRALRENFTQRTQAPANRNARSKQWQPWLAACQRKRLRFMRFSFTQRTQRKQASAFEWKPGLRHVLYKNYELTGSRRRLWVDVVAVEWKWRCGSSHLLLAVV